MHRARYVHQQRDAAPASDSLSRIRPPKTTDSERIATRADIALRKPAVRWRHRPANVGDGLIDIEVTRPPSLTDGVTSSSRPYPCTGWIVGRCPSGDGRGASDGLLITHMDGCCVIIQHHHGGVDITLISDFRPRRSHRLYGARAVRDSVGKTRNAWLQPAAQIEKTSARVTTAQIIVKRPLQPVLQTVC